MNDFNNQGYNGGSYTGPNQNFGQPYGQQGGMGQQPYGQGQNMGQQPYGQGQNMGQQYGQPYGQQGGMNPQYGQPQNPAAMQYQPAPKKGKGGLIAVFVIAGVLVLGAVIALVVFVLSFAGKTYPNVEAADFTTACEAYGLVTYTETDTEKMDPASSVMAYAHDEKWDTFYEYNKFSTEDDARSFYGRYAFDNSNGPSTYVKVTGKNYEYTSGIDGGIYYYTIRVDNTVIIATGFQSERSTLDGVLSTLGYLN